LTKVAKAAVDYIPVKLPVNAERSIVARFAKPCKPDNARLPEPEIFIVFADVALPCDSAT
jgi:hypothetical protein